MNPQNMTALAKANEIRIEMAEIKKGIKTGALDPVEVIHTCELPMKALDLLAAIPRVGPDRAYKTLHKAGMHERHYLGGGRRDGRQPMTEDQRARLACEVGWIITPTARHTWREAVAA